MRSQLRTLIFTVFAVSIGAPLASAQSKEIDPKARKVANEVVRQLTPPHTYQDMLKQMTDGMLPAIQQQAGGQLPPDFQKRLIAAVSDALPYEDLISWSADLYAARFTEGELKEVLKFYKTPVGLKLGKVMPEIMGESGKKMAEILPTRLPEAMKKQGLMQ
jgi:hypothetical protein